MTSGSRLGPFHLLEPVGEGGQATVWKGRDLRNGNVVAVKILRTALTGPHELERLQREAALLQQLQDPGIPRGLELVRDDAQGLAGLAMEFVDGETLAAASGRTRISTLQALSIGREVARVLSVAHGRGVVHRDVKPANILLRPGWETQAQGHVVLVDFGIAKAETGATQYTATGAAIGTVAFMAPELLLLRSGDRAPLAPSLDVYSTGVVVWTMLFGRLPSGLPIQASMSELVLSHARPGPTAAPPDRRAEVESRAPGLMALLERCVSPNPAARPQDGGVLAGELARHGVPGGSPTAQAAPSAHAAQSWTSAVAGGGGYTQYSGGPTAHGALPQDPSRVAATALVEHSKRDGAGNATGLAVVLGVAGFLALAVVAMVGVAFFVLDPSSSSGSGRKSKRSTSNGGETYDAPAPAKESPSQESQERATLLSIPAQLVRASATQADVSGVFTTTCTTKVALFKNSSLLPVRNPTGAVQYLDKNGVQIVAVPYAATGEVRPGGQATLRLTTEPVHGNCKLVRLTVERVETDLHAAASLWSPGHA